MSAASVELDLSGLEPSRDAQLDDIEAVASGDLQATGYIRKETDLDLSGLEPAPTSRPAPIAPNPDEVAFMGRMSLFTPPEFAEERQQELAGQLASMLPQARGLAGLYGDTLKAVELSQRTGLPVNTALENPAEVQRMADDLRHGPTVEASLHRLEAMAPTTAAFVRDSGPALVAALPERMEEVGLFEESLREADAAMASGALQVELTSLQNRLFWAGDNPDPRDTARRDEIMQALAVRQQQRKGEGFWLGAYRGTFETVLPQAGEYSYRFAEGGLKAGAAVALASLVAGPAALPAAGSAFAAGGGANGIMYAFEMSLGELYGALTAMKDEDGNPIDNDTARLLAFAGAIPSTALEVVGIRQVMNLVPGARRFINAGTVEAAKKIVQSNPALAKSLGGVALETVTALGTEMGVEMSQEGISVAVEEAGKALAEGQVFQPITIEDVADRLAETGYEALKSFVIPVGFGGGGLRAGNSVYNYRLARASAEKNAATLERLAGAAGSSRLVREAPAATEEMLTRIAEQGGASAHVYINPEAVQRVLFQNDAGLKLAREAGIEMQDVADALTLGTPVAVPLGKAVTRLFATEQGKTLLPDMTLTPDAMTREEAQTFGAALPEEAATLAQGVFDFLAFIEEGVAEAASRRDMWDAATAPYVEQLEKAGYTQTQSRHYADVWAAHAERMAPLYGMEPGAWLHERLQGVRTVDPATGRVLTQESEDRAMSQRLRREMSLVERDPLRALVWGRLDGKSLKDAYHADTLKAMTQANGRGLFRSKEKGGIALDELADEAVRAGLLPEGSTADTLVERLKTRKMYQQHGDEHTNLVILRGDELGVSGEADITALRKAAWEVYQTFRDDPVHREDLGHIRFTRSGFKKALTSGADPRKWKLMPKLREIIAHGDYLGRKELTKIRKDDIVAFHWIEADVVLDKERLRVGVQIAEDRKGNKFYNINQDIVEWKKHYEAPDLAAIKHGNQELLQKDAVASSDTKIRHRLDGVNMLLKPCAPRGSISFDDAAGALITVFRGRNNLSTILHETSHFFLENLRDAAMLETAPDWVKHDWQALAAHFGIRGHTISREAHEAFARFGEAYFREGRAPRAELAGAFAQFRAWLSNVYRSVRRLLGADELTDDVRGVFDRLLASEEDMAAARDSAAPAPVLENVGNAVAVTPEKLDAFREAVRRGKEKGDALVALQRLHEQQRVEREARDEARAMIEASPFYGGLLSMAREGGLDVGQLAQFAGEDSAWLVRERWNADRPRNGKSPVRERGTLTVDDAAGHFGLADGMELVGRLITEPTRAEFTKQHVATRLAQWEAVYSPDMEYLNDVMDEALRAEIEALGGNPGVSANTLRRTLDLRTGVRKAAAVDAEYAALKADLAKQRAIIGKVVRDLRKAGRMEQRWSDAGKNTTIADLRSRLVRLKEEERLKRAAMAANYRARVERDKLTRSLQRTVRQKGIAEPFRQQMLALVARWKGLGTDAMRPMEGTPTFMEFVSALQSELVTDLPAFPEWLFEVPQRGTLRASELSLEQLRDIDRAVRMLAHQGKTVSALAGMLEKKTLADAVDETTASMKRLSGQSHLSELKLKTKLGKLRHWFRETSAAMTVLRYVFSAADGYKTANDGANNRLIVQPIQEAQSREQAMLREYGAKLRAITEQLDPQAMGKVFDIEGLPMASPEIARELQGQWTLERVLAVALNRGNAGNLKALTKGYGWEEADVDRITSRLTAGQWSVVQQIWDMVDELYPRLNATYETLYGVPMPKVEAAPFTVTTADGQTLEMSGGYYPLIFDRAFSERVQQLDELDQLNATEAIVRTPNPKSGMTKERKGGGLPPKLSLGVLYSHMADSIRYATHMIPLRNAYRIINDKAYKRAFQQAFGAEMYDQLVPWLRHMARPEKVRLDGVNAALDWMARRGSLFTLGFSFLTSMKQLTSLPQSWSEIGAVPLLKGGYAMLTSPVDTYRMVRELSPYMERRAVNLDRDMAASLNKLSPGGAGFGFGRHRITGEQWENAAFSLIQTFDAAVAYPTWVGKYRDAIAGGAEQQAAIRMADEAVIRAQGSGLAMDTTALMRKPGAARLVTMFMSFAMNWQNRQRYFMGGYAEYLKTGQSEIGHAAFFRHFALEWLLPPMLSLLLVAFMRDGEEPDAGDIAGELMGYWLMGIPLVREIPAMLQYGKKNIGSAAFRGVESVTGAAKALYKLSDAKDQDEALYRTGKLVIDAVGFGLGIPTPAMWRHIEGTEAFMRDEGGPLAPLLGPPPRKNGKKRENEWRWREKGTTAYRYSGE